MAKAGKSGKCGKCQAKKMPKTFEYIAVDRVRAELEKCKDYSEKVNVLSIKVRWGQGKLCNLGRLTDFLAKYPDDFLFEDTSVMLTHPPIKYGQFLYLLEDVRED